MDTERNDLIDSKYYNWMDTEWLQVDGYDQDPCLWIRTRALPMDSSMGYFLHLESMIS